MSFLKKFLLCALFFGLPMNLAGFFVGPSLINPDIFCLNKPFVLSSGEAMQGCTIGVTGYPISLVQVSIEQGALPYGEPMWTFAGYGVRETHFVYNWNMALVLWDNVVLPFILNWIFWSVVLFLALLLIERMKKNQKGSPPV